MSSEPELIEYGPNGRPSLTFANASRFAALALKGITTEYPNKIAHVMRSDSDLAPPRELHPAFYGCFDWHSSVHSHWMLIHLLRTFPDLPAAQPIRSTIQNNIQAENIIRELEYIKPKKRRSFERPYGWAWLLKLGEELYRWDDPQAQEWATALQPLADHIESLYIDFLPKQLHPVRSGAHSNTAFGLSFAWDYAHLLGRNKLKATIENAAQRYFSVDTDYPAHYEPSGTDFLSPCLEEANLMLRVLDHERFTDWFDQFLPQIPDTLRQPAAVADRTDGQLVHLDGLNLSRAWCFANISRELAANSSKQEQLGRLATKHIEAALPYIASGNYEGEHWLATFAVYALSAADARGN